MRLLSWIVLGMVLWGTALWAHQSALSYLHLQKVDAHTLRMRIKKPLRDLGSPDLSIEFPRGCSRIQKRIFMRGGYRIREESYRCSVAALHPLQLRITNLKQSDAGVIFGYHGDGIDIEGALVTADNPLITIKKGDKKPSLLAFVRLGVEHILSGYDHLLFILSLMMLVPNLRLLIATISAFTVAHSLTLGLSMFGLIHFSVAYDEALIALSILFLAREILKGDTRTLSYRFPWIVALLFGLIHGMGFATALREIGLPENHRIATLFLFNVGVEMGQLLFIMIVLGARRLLLPIVASYRQRIRYATLYAIGTISAYWFIERIFVIF